MTKDEFIDSYCKKSKISWDTLSKSQVVLPCECKDELCQGWAMCQKMNEQAERNMRADEK